jgi:hypothetical protein
MMKTHELRSALQAAGWRIDNSPWIDGVAWYAWRRLEGAVNCACNDKPPSLCLQAHEVWHDGVSHRSVEFEVCGEAGGQWLKLKAYSVPMDEALQAIPRCTALLLAAWNAAAASRQVTLDDWTIQWNLKVGKQ